ncbi:MAG: hypothetical protein WA937_13160 [Flavobacteriales bacterium]
MAAVLVYGCHGPVATEQPASDPAGTNFQGEVRILPGDTAFGPCGSLAVFRLTGPGLDSIAHRYTYLNTVPGQWIKTWLSGHYAPDPAGGPDSLLIAERYMHMDVAVTCPPVPDRRMAGNYVADPAQHADARTTRLLLLPNGDATSFTSSNTMHTEVDGHWGINKDGQLIFVEYDGKYSFAFAQEQGRLVRVLAGNARGAAYVREGPPVRLQGAFGRTARWLAEVATAQGHPLRAEDVRPAMPLDSLFPDAASQAALRASAAEQLNMDEHQLSTTWTKAENVQDVTMLMRAHSRAER